MECQKGNFIQQLTGASNLPVKNFLTFLANDICSGVTVGSFIQGLPATKEKGPGYNFMTLKVNH